MSPQAAIKLESTFYTTTEIVVTFLDCTAYRQSKASAELTPGEAYPPPLSSAEMRANEKCKTCCAAETSM